MGNFSRSFVIECKDVLSGEVYNTNSYEECVRLVQVGIKWLKKRLRENGGKATCRGNDGRLWMLEIKYKKACKLVPCFDGDVPTQYCPSYSAAIALLNISSRTFYANMNKYPLGETFVIKDCFKREWMCCCYQEKQSYPFGSKKTKAIES